MPAEPPPTTTRSASSATGSRSSGTVTVPADTSASGRGVAGRGREVLPEPLRHRGHGLEKHVEPCDVGTRRARERLLVGGERAIERVLLTGDDRLVGPEARVHLVREGLEP